MNILLVHPKMNHGPVTKEDKGNIFGRIYSANEITLLAVAACIPKEHDIKIIHENFEDIDYSKKYDLVGISCFTHFAPQVYEIADKFRSLGMPVVLGGYHVSAMPHEAKQHADSIVIGEAELAFPKLIGDLKKGKLKPFYKAKELVKAEDIPSLRRDLFKHNKYSSGIRITRGCSNKCEFCAITSFFNHKYRKRPIQNVIRDFKNMPHKVISVQDSTLTADLEYCKKLYRAMIKEKVNKKWLGIGNINVLGRDEEYLQLSKEAGCICWTTGIESVSQESLNSVNKKANDVEKYSRWIQTIKKHGMAVNGLFIFGFDHDYPDIFDKTLDALKKLEVDSGEFNILTPLPGTPLYEKMDSDRRILTKDWSKYTHTQTVFKPKHMTVEELDGGFKKVVSDFFSMSNILKRNLRLMKISAHPSTMSTLLTMNMSHRKWYQREFDF